MKDKKNLILILAAVIALIAVILLCFKIFNVRFNIITYHSFEQNGYSFTFKGSSGEVRKLKIEKDSKKTATLPFEASPDIFKNEFGFSAKFADINNDGLNDLILPRTLDDDVDVHYQVYLANDETFIYSESLCDLSNISIDEENSLIFTDRCDKEVLVEETKFAPEFFERKHTIAKHSFIDGEFITLEERAITYYSENDYYCYSIYRYDEGAKELKYVDEQWFDPEEIEGYPLNWD